MAAKIEGEAGPRTATTLVGHAAAEQALLEAWSGGRLHHGWLLTGPRGIGKATLAYRFARFLLANGDPGGGLFAPTGLAVPADHPVARRVASGAHADLFVLERDVNERTGRLQTVINVENTRRLIDFFTLTPAEGGWRVAIVDGAEDMNPSAANAILKILEEPPKRAILLLVTHAPGRLLPTIRSRVRRLQLRPLPEDAVMRLLRERFSDLTTDDAAELARLAEGSPGRAMSLAEAGGLELNRELDRLLARLPALDVPALHALADRAARGEKGMAAFAVLGELLTRWLAAAVRAGQAPGRASLDQWLAVWDKVSGLLARAEGANLDRKQVLLSAILAVQRAAGG